ncbi:MAG: hypothetical protein U0930_03905 [Pirellulales bacterium]
MSVFSTSSELRDSNGQHSLQVALAILANHGFKIVSHDSRSARLSGPGLNSTKQNPLLGATSIQLVLEDHRLKLIAELGGVDSMRRFLMSFPFLLGLGLGLLFGVGGGLLFGRNFGVGFGVPWAQGWNWMLFTLALSVLPVAPWLFLSPMIAGSIRNRTQQALSTLANNAVQLSLE